MAEKDERLAQHEAEIAQLKVQIAAAQATTAPDTRDYDEAAARDLFIDVLLHEAGWEPAEERDREYEVAGMPNADGKGFVDYVLWGADGLPLAVVEAKRTAKSPEVGQQQAKLYADCLEKQFGRRPVIFYTNGYEHRIWDDAGGYPPRETQGFYTRGELELLIQRRRTKLELTSAPVNTDIAGRPYQVRAIKAVGGAFDRKQREALLVMATGSGKAVRSRLLRPHRHRRGPPLGLCQVWRDLRLLRRQRNSRRTPRMRLVVRAREVSSAVRSSSAARPAGFPQRPLSRAPDRDRPEPSPGTPAPSGGSSWRGSCSPCSS